MHPFLQRWHVFVAWSSAVAACGLLSAAPRSLADDWTPPASAAAATATDATPAAGTSGANVAEGGEATATVSDEVQQGAEAVQRALGGSIVNQFPSFRQQSSRAATSATPWYRQFTGSLDASAPPPAWPGPPTAAAPPGRWPNWASQPPASWVVPATAEIQAPRAELRPVAALRSTAAQLDASANQLEELDLYRQADALRDLAQQMRVDARRLTPLSDAPAVDEPPRDPGAQDAGSEPDRRNPNVRGAGEAPRRRARPNEPPRPPRGERNPNPGDGPRR